MDLSIVIRGIIYGLYWITVLSCIMTIIFEHREPSRSLAWIVVIMMLPVVGILLFFFFGQNFRRKWIQNKRISRSIKYAETIYKRQIKSIGETDANDFSADNKQLINLLYNNSRSVLTRNNSLEILHDGKQTFEEIISSLKQAKRSINLEYYIFEEDELSNTICNILIQKAHEGVSVRLLYDDVGSWKLSKKFIRNLEKEGIKTSKFFPVFFPLLSSRINNRNHRKIIVIDGTVGFTGGINIAQRYLSDTWHDTHLKISGSGAKFLQLVFMHDWNYATKETIRNWQDYINLKDKTVYGNIPLQIVPGGPSTPWASIMQAYFEIITKARKTIYISTPYFTPSFSILTALKIASLGGVDVKIMLPKESDVILANLATRSYFKELMDAGIKIYLYHLGFVHTKMICVDGNICSIGTVNMDERSFEDNYEITAMIYDKEKVKEVSDHFIKQCNKSILLTPEKWESRKHYHELLEAMARLISPLL